MIASLRTPTGRIVFGLVTSAVLVALTLLVEPGMVAILPALLVPIWIPLIGTDRVNTRSGRTIMWVLGIFLAGTFVLGLLVFLA